MENPYAMELRHDGSRLVLSCEGAEQRSLAVGSLRSGAVFLCASSDYPVRVERLTIEGVLPPGGFARLERARIERELAGF